MSAEQAVYTHDGYPANLTAAASDALEWLELVKRENSEFSLEGNGYNRLCDCIRFLRENLAGSMPEAYLPKPRVYGDAVSVIVGSSPAKIEAAQNEN